MAGSVCKVGEDCGDVHDGASFKVLLFHKSEYYVDLTKKLLYTCLATSSVTHKTTKGDGMASAQRAPREKHWGYIHRPQGIWCCILLFFGCFSNVSSPVLRGGKEEEKKL